MRLAASQIGWLAQDAAGAMQILKDAGFAGLEIAPTIAVGERPYERPEAIARYAGEIRSRYGLALCSMQSIWYGQEGSVFGPERERLYEYTKAAMRFAAAGGIGNLVFGCPKNRVLPEGMEYTAADGFFAGLAEYAAEQRTVLALEANPAMYGTNFMNTTTEALEAVKRVSQPGCKLNLDFGTMVQNGETVDALRGQIGYINHVHISEPNLAPVRPHARHRALAALLREEGYTGYVSIEMKAVDLEALRRTAEYVAEVFA